MHHILIAERGLCAKKALQASKALGLETTLLKSEKFLPAWGELSDNIVEPPISEANATAQNFGIIATALQLGCDSIFPSWDEKKNPYTLSALSKASRITFVGGNPETLSSVNNRIGIRWAAKDLKMDVIPSSDKIETVEDALIWILKFGYPIVMRTLRTPSQKISDEKDMWKIEEALEKGPIVLERFLENAREIETVMFGIKGELPVCLGEGEISQKLNGIRAFAEFPPLGISNKRLNKIRVQAAKLILGTGWEGIISARFLVTPDGMAYFLQLNPGIQPWHTAVEVSLGVDLYDAQIRVAMEDDLGWKQTDIRFSGHTLSMMIYSKESGYITNLSIPSELFSEEVKGFVGDSKRKVHWGPLVGDLVEEDELLGTLSVQSVNRELAVIVAKQFLDELTVEGVQTNLQEFDLLFSQDDFWKKPPQRSNQELDDDSEGFADDSGIYSEEDSD